MNAKLALAGLGAGFRALAETGGGQPFRAAQAAAWQLGLRLSDLDATARGHFQKYVAAEGAGAGKAVTLDGDLDILLGAVVEASY